MLLLLFKGHIMSNALSRSFDIDLIVLFIPYLVVSRSQTGAGIYAFCLGFLTDILSGGFMGLFTMIYLVIFLWVLIGSRPFDLLSYGGQIVLVAVSVMLKGFLVIGFHYLFSLRIFFPFFDFIALLSSAVIAGLVAPFIFGLLNYLDLIFAGGDEEV